MDKTFIYETAIAIMLVNVLLITYNQERYIKQAIEGILMQRLGENVTVRIIVADDCSTDHTFDTIKSLLGDKATYLSRERNLGHVRNYQRAFAACDGDYVGIIEGDDYWTDAYHLQTHIDFLQAHPECVLSTSHPMFYYEEQNRFKQNEAKPLLFDGYKYRTLEEEIRLNTFENLSACVIRAEALRQLDERIFSCSILDWPMYVNLAQMGALCLMSGSSNVYRIKKSGEYAGLSHREQVKRDLRLISEIGAVFPAYAPYYRQARELLKTPRLKDYLISLGKKAKRWVEQMIRK